MEFLFPAKMTLSQAQALKPTTALANDSQALLQALGKACLSSNSTSLKALGFWLRPAHLKQMQATVSHLSLRPRGQVLQVAPGNVDMLFLYVALLALWMGNVVVVRLSSRQGDDEAQLLTLLQTLQAEPTLAAPLSRLLLLRCEHQDSDWLNWLATTSTRIFWGSDTTVQTLSTLPKAPHCQELLMGHKHSLCLLDAQAILTDPDGHWASAFIRDTLEFGQQGCASPRTLIWHGNDADVAQAQRIFWQRLASGSDFTSASAQRLLPDEAALLDRLTALQLLAMDGELNTPWQSAGPFVRVSLQSLDPVMEQRHPAQGVVYEMIIDDLDDLLGQLRPWHQTLTFFGWQRDTLVNWAVTQALPGLDRIEPLGQALVFDPIWDGVNLLQQLGRQLR